jgi:hypothetical protein
MLSGTFVKCYFARECIHAAFQSQDRSGRLADVNNYIMNKTNKTLFLSRAVICSWGKGCKNRSLVINKRALASFLHAEPELLSCYAISELKLGTGGSEGEGMFCLHNVNFIKYVYRRLFLGNHEIYMCGIFHACNGRVSVSVGLCLRRITRKHIF